VITKDKIAKTERRVPKLTKGGASEASSPWQK